MSEERGYAALFFGCPLYSGATLPQGQIKGVKNQRVQSGQSPSMHKLKETHAATHTARTERISSGEALEATEEGLLATLAAEEEEDSEG